MAGQLMINDACSRTSYIPTILRVHIVLLFAIDLPFSFPRSESSSSGTSPMCLLFMSPSINPPSAINRRPERLRCFAQSMDIQQAISPSINQQRSQLYMPSLQGKVPLSAGCLRRDHRRPTKVRAGSDASHRGSGPPTKTGRQCLLLPRSSINGDAGRREVLWGVAFTAATLVQSSEFLSQQETAAAAPRNAESMAKLARSGLL